MLSKIFQRFIVGLYLKNFFVIFLSLEIFYVGVDLIANLKNLPISANLQLLYAFYNAQIAITYTLPISLIFALILTQFSLIKSNELISFYTCSISKNQILILYFCTALCITFILICLNCTSLVNANKYRSSILDGDLQSHKIKELFFKYSQSYVYIDKLDIFEKKAYDIKIFEVKNEQLSYILKAKSATFINNAWHIKEAQKIILPEIKKLNSKALRAQNLKDIKVLPSFKPQVLDALNDAKGSLNLIDALNAYSFLSKIDQDTTNIRAKIYSLSLFPLFAPIMLVILYYFMPLISRFSNLALLSFAFIFVSLFVWGCLFLLVKFTQTNIINPELGIAFPIFLLALYALMLYKKNK